MRALTHFLLLMLFVSSVIADDGEVSRETEQYQAGARALAERDYGEAIKIWKRLGRRGNAASSFNLGVIYAEGRIVEQNLRRARRWFKKAAKNGHPEAQYNLGHFYMQGSVGKPKPKRAVYWWREAARRGLLVAQYNLAYALYHGIGADADQKEAIKWFRRAAADGEARSGAFLKERGLSYGFSIEREQQPTATSTKSAKPAAEAGAVMPTEEVPQVVPTETPILEPEQNPEAATVFGGTRELDEEPQPNQSVLEDVATVYSQEEQKQESFENPGSLESNPSSSDETLQLPPTNPAQGRKLQVATSFNDDSWLFEQQPGNVAVQLASMRGLSWVEDALRDNPFLKEGGKFFSSSAEGEHWVYLLYGSFPGTVAAEEALARLPKWAQEGTVLSFSTLRTRRCDGLDEMRELLGVEAVEVLEGFCVQRLANEAQLDSVSAVAAISGEAVPVPETTLTSDVSELAPPPTAEPPATERSSVDDGMAQTDEADAAFAEEPGHEAHALVVNFQEWLFDQPPENLTLQLASLRQESTLTKMVQDDAFLGRDGKFFTTLVDGERWTYLLYGSYQDEVSALEARADLPRWAQQAIIREFSYLQSQRCGSLSDLREVLRPQEAEDLKQLCSGKGYQ